MARMMMKLFVIELFATLRYEKSDQQNLSLKLRDIGSVSSPCIVFSELDINSNHNFAYY